MKFFFLFFISIAFQLSILAQPGRTIYLSNNLHTLQLKVNNKEDLLPILKKNGMDVLEVSFDDLTHEYKRYTYKIEHCDVEGKPTEGLFENEYVKSVADEEVIDNYQASENTTVLYTHYSFTIPNTHVRPLLSGNYRITISTENDEGDACPVLYTYFGVVDTKVGIAPTCSTNTEIDWNNSHQQLSVRLDANNLTLRDAENEIKLVVLQNRRWDNAVINPHFTAQNGNILLWEHTKDLIFDAGNEFRKMEILSTRYPGMHGESVKWFDPYYHYTFMTDYQRKNYLYDEDRNGLYVTRWEGSENADIEADYVMAHFTLDMPEIANSKVYIYGTWAGEQLNNRFLMHYDVNEQKYTSDVLLKCGYYNYLYLTVNNNMPTKGNTSPIEGNFFQTENEYDFLVYYRPTGGRYWQLVGCTTPSYRKH